MKFNYSQLHYFDSKGREMPLVYSAPRITFVNPRFESEYGEYLVVRKDNDTDDVYFKKTLTGKRFRSTDDVKCTLTSPYGIYNITLPNEECHFVEYTSTYKYKDKSTGEDKNECYLSSFDELYALNLLEGEGFNANNLPFPSLKFTSKLSFNKVSTGLVETESIYILAENENNKYSTVSDLLLNKDDDNFLSKYQLMFFIDCREQSNFRFFTTSESEVTWSDRKFIDFSADNNYAIGDNISGYRVDVGFVGEHDGVYEDKMYVFLIDRTFASPDYPGDAYLIGEINLLAETEGEDERYRTFFDNFGVPDPKVHYQAFADTDILEESLDYMKINDYSKKMFLSYDQIFPYAGTYKALINALKALGYNDVIFKEWYKEIGSPNKNSLIAYDIFDNDKKHNETETSATAWLNRRSSTNNQNENKKQTKQNVLNTITNASLEERVQLKKLNWISMVYKMTQESSLPIDRFGFPGTEKVSNYYDNGTLVKLMSLKKYLDDYILGSNCRIIDVAGEGVVFERYNISKYGSYQQVLEYDNEKSIAIDIDVPHAVINDGKAEITGKIITTNSNISFDDFKTEQFVDYCDGYITETGEYKRYSTDTVLDDTKTIYCGKTLELNDNNVRYEVRSLGKTESFRFGDTFLTNNSPSLIIDEGDTFFDPKDLIEKHTNCAFLPERLPIIQIKEGVIKSSSYKCEIYNSDNTYKININDEGDFILNDICTIVPPKFIRDEIDSNDDYVGKLRRYIKQPSTGNILSYIVNTNDTFPYIPNETYGLRYVDDNEYCNLPQFKIKGYNFNELSYKNNKNLSGDELVLSIINGKMFFDDVDNNRKVVINFKPNENNTIEISVEILQHEYIDGTYKYLSSIELEDGSKSTTLTSTLDTNTDYSPLKDLYKAYRYDDAISYNPEIKLTYNNTGTYKVNVMMYDLCNNVFSSVSKKNITISTPYLGTMMYTNEAESNGWVYHESTISIFPDDDNNNCLYKREPKRQLVNALIRMQHHTFDKDMQNPVYHLLGCSSSRNELYNDINNTRLQSLDKKGKFAQFSNTTDKLTLNDVITITHSDDTTEKVLLFDSLYTEDNRHVLINKEISTIDDIDTIQTDEQMVRLCVYNSLSESFMYHINGYMAKYNNNLVFVFDDKSTKIDDLRKPYIEVYCVPCWYIETDISFENSKNIFNLNNKAVFNQNDILKICYNHDGINTHGSCLVVAKSKNRNNINEQFNENFTTEQNITSHIPDNNVHFYISPMDDDYTSYIMKLSNESTVDIISGDGSRNSKKIAQHIGRGFTTSIRDFDITVGQKWYNDGLSYFQNGVTYGHTGQIITNGFVAMKTGIPKDYYYADCRGIGDWDDDVEKTQNEIFAVEQNKKGKSFRWKIYKQNKYSNSHELKVECFNEYPIFFIDEKGIYDVDVTLYDEYGNKFVKNSSAAITVI